MILAPVDHVDLLARTAQAANAAGDQPRALSLSQEALRELDSTSETERAAVLLERCAWYQMRCGQVTEALATYREADRRATDATPAVRSRVRASWANSLARVGDIDEAERLATEARRDGDEVDDRFSVGQARHALGLVAAARGDVDRAVDDLLSAGAVALDLGDLPEVAGAFVHLWRTLLEAGRGDELADLLQSQVPARPRHADQARLLAAITAIVLHELGRIDEALELVDTERTDLLTTLPGIVEAVVRGTVLLDRGDFAAARASLAAARAGARRTGDGRLNGLLYRALADLAIWEGRPGSVQPLVDEGLDILTHTGDPELAARLVASGVRALG